MLMTVISVTEYLWRWLSGSQPDPLSLLAGSLASRPQSRGWLGPRLTSPLTGGCPHTNRPGWVPGPSLSWTSPDTGSRPPGEQEVQEEQEDQEVQEV